MGRVRRAVALCDASDAAPLVIFVSKMIAVKKRDLTDVNGRPWRPLHLDRPGELPPSVQGTNGSPDRRWSREGVVPAGGDTRGVPHEFPVRTFELRNMRTWEQAVSVRT